MCNKYNGYSNYPTWCVSLWIDNEEGTYNQRCEYARQAWDETYATQYLTHKENATQQLVDQLKEWIEEENPLDNASMFTDLLGYAIELVNWYEIAENFLEDYEEEDELEED